MANSSTSVLSRDAIQKRMRRGYLERLEARVRKMRVFLAERQWDSLRVELTHIQNTGPTFDFTDLANDAGSALDTLKRSPQEARTQIEELLRKLDHRIEGTPSELLV